jgi:cardiolipin synthase
VIEHVSVTAAAADVWPLLVSGVHISGAIAVTVDAVLRKRQVPAVIGWVGLAWLAPIIGSLLYLGFGINRIQRAAVALQRSPALGETGEWRIGTTDRALLDTLAARSPTLTGLVRLGEHATGNPLLPGNRITPLRDGDEAYPVMLAAIRGASRSIALQSYIFDHDAVGITFRDALVDAVRRGVEVRVLIDDVGSHYARPSMARELRKRGVRTATFLPTKLAPVFRYANLRNHRKILVVDGQLGFTGGMNIREGHELTRAPVAPVRCLHFQLEGPIVYELQRTFAEDWAFTARELLNGDTWFPQLGRVGNVYARGIPDGPDSSIDNTLELLLGALASAMTHVRIISPYFLLDDVMIRALQVTALRGVNVDIVVPEKSNLPVMDWAMTPQFAPLLDKGCRIWRSRAPFDHTKAFTVDGQWSLIGSTNWDARSLLLNFEFNVECYDQALTAQLDALINERIASATPVTLAGIRARSLPVQLRDGIARLGSPYL